MKDVLFMVYSTFIAVSSSRKIDELEKEILDEG